MSATESAIAPESALVRFLRLIRFSHTIFALPFALGALAVAAQGRPSPRTLLLVLACMVFARTAAMLFNRFIRNPKPLYNIWQEAGDVISRLRTRS